MGDTAAASQFVDVDIRALAGNDSIAVTGSFVTTTVRAGTGNDTLDIEGRTNAGSAASAFCAGAGADSLEVQGNTVTVYGGDSADDTADGADTIYVSTLVTSTVYGAGGADSIQLATAIQDSRIEGGAGASTVFGGGAGCSHHPGRCGC